MSLKRSQLELHSSFNTSSTYSTIHSKAKNLYNSYFQASNYSLLSLQKYALPPRQLKSILLWMAILSYGFKLARLVKVWKEGGRNFQKGILCFRFCWSIWHACLNAGFCCEVGTLGFWFCLCSLGSSQGLGRRLLR